MEGRGVHLRTCTVYTRRLLHNIIQTVCTYVHTYINASSIVCNDSQDILYTLCVPIRYSIKNVLGNKLNFCGFQVLYIEGSASIQFGLHM